MGFARLIIIFALTVALAAAQEPGSVLSGSEITAHFEVRFRPGSRAEASVDRVLSLVEGDLARILEELGLRQFRHRIKLFLYDDVAELQRITGVPSSGHSVTLESHVPHDNDQTRVHELVHVVAEKFAEKGPEPRNLFFAEGLANAVLRFVHGVDVHAVAAFYRSRDELPSLAEIHAIPDFYRWQSERPGLNAYDIGGSYFRHLLDTYGREKTRKYYCGVPAREAFGATLGAIEKGWHARLEKVSLRPGLKSLLEERADGPAAALKASPEAVLSDAILGNAPDWTRLDLTPVSERAPASWRKDGGGHASLELTGQQTEGDWCIVRLGSDQFGDAIVRCKAEALEGCFGAQVQLGMKCQGMLLRDQGAFLYAEDRALAHNGKVAFPSGPVDLVLRRSKGRASFWINGKLVLEAEVDSSPAFIAIGCVGGKARFSDLVVRSIRR